MIGAKKPVGTASVRKVSGVWISHNEIKRAGETVHGFGLCLTDCRFIISVFRV